MLLKNVYYFTKMSDMENSTPYQEDEDEMNKYQVKTIYREWASTILSMVNENGIVLRIQLQILENFSLISTIHGASKFKWI